MNTSDLKSPLSSQLEELEGLLAKQIRLAQQGNLHGHEIEALTRQADALVAQIIANWPEDSNEFENCKRRLRELYDVLGLALAIEKAHISKQLSRIRRGKKIVRTYQKRP